MSVAGILAPIVIYLAAAITAHPAGLQPVQSESPPKETLIININGGDYREADGTVVLSVIASNSTTRDAVITAAHLVHISLTPGGDLVFGYKKSGRLPLFKPLTVGGGKAQVFEVISEVDLADFYNDGLEPTNLPEDRRSNARAGRLFLELRAIDGFGRTYQNYFRIGTVTVFRENGKYLRPLVITNGRSRDAFSTETLEAVMMELGRKD